LDIEAALALAVAGLDAQSGTLVTVDIGYQSIAISSCGEWPSIQVLAHPHARSPQSETTSAPLS
jgi:hypothetical protein